jgi:hypothetical protein
MFRARPKKGSDDKLVPELTKEAGSPHRYRNAFGFINGEILHVIDGILANSRTLPVIVIRGDYAPFLDWTAQKHLAIHSAYYWSGTNNTPCYPSISPINTFRIVFDTYSREYYPLMREASWFSRLDDRWISESVPSGCNNQICLLQVQP